MNEKMNEKMIGGCFLSLVKDCCAKLSQNKSNKKNLLLYFLK